MKSSKHLLGVLFLCAGIASAQQAWNTVKVWDSGPTSNRFDIVVMGDGYTAAQLGSYATHVTNFVNYYLSVPPFDRYKNHINIWRVDVVSAQSGADHPAPCYASPTMVNTELDATYCTGGTQRCITTNTTKVLSTALINVPNYDKIIVLVNDPEYGGCAGGTVCNTTSLNGSFLEVATHELGHTNFGLADEYWSSGATYSGGQPSQPNVANQNQATMLTAQTKWWYWIGIEGVGAFEGGFYNEFGIWRPKPNCKMQSLGVAFCPICREDSLADVWTYVPNWDQVTPAPAGGPYLYNTVLSVTGPALGTGTLLAEWIVDGGAPISGQVVTVGNQTTYSFDPSTVLAPSSGGHSVVFRITDTTTWYRKTSPYRPLPQITWSMTDSFSDYRITAVAPTTPPVRAGELFHMTDTVENQGTTPGPAVHVGYYLSTDLNITTNDYYCGGRTVPSLAPGQSNSGGADVRVPVGFPLNGMRLGAIVDDLFDAAETNETNNSATATGIFTITSTATLGGSPFFVSLASGSTGQITFNAGTAHAGDYYYVLVSASAPGGGTDMGPLIGVAPFTADPLTYDVLNGVYPAPIFAQMTGVIPVTGQATASWAFPALGPGLPQGVLRWWAFVLDYDPGTGSLSIPLISNRFDVLLL